MTSCTRGFVVHIQPSSSGNLTHNAYTEYKECSFIDACMVSLHVTSPDHIQRVADWRCLWSSSSSLLVIRRTRLSGLTTVGRPSEAVSGTVSVCHATSYQLRLSSGPTLALLRKCLKTFLFSRSFHNFVSYIYTLFSGLAVIYYITQ